MARKTDTIAPNDNPVQRDWDGKFDDIMSQLHDAEVNPMREFEDDYSNNKTAPSEDEEHAIQRAKNKNQQEVLDKEQQGSTDPTTAINHTANVTPKDITSTPQLAKVLLKRGGPAGLLGIVLLVGGMFLGTAVPGSLLLNLKENLTLHWDQQNYTAEIRSQKILAARLSDKAVSGPCVGVSTKILCRYQKPSQRLLDKIASEGIEAFDKSGNVIEKQALLLGKTRPTAYRYVNTSGKEMVVGASNFSDALTKDVEFRQAFRRAYNPRWVNWFDDAAAKFLSKLGLVKKIPTKLASSATEASAVDALQEVADGKTTSLGGDETAIENTIKNTVDDVAEKDGKILAKDIKAGAKGDSVMFAAAATCATARLPGLFSSVIRNIRLAQMAAVVFPVAFTLADQLKANDNSVKPEFVSSVGSMFTQEYKQADGTKILSAMSSGAILYGLTGDVGSAVAQKDEIKKYIPGYTGNGTFDQVANISNSPQIKSVCSALTSSSAQVVADALTALKAAKAATPIGWIGLAVDAVVWGLDVTGALEAILAPIITAGIKAISPFIPWQQIIDMIMGDLVKNATGIKFGHMVGVLSIALAVKAAGVGNRPLTPKQAVAFDEQVVKPTQLAWAQEDRLTHSPFDISNPNTALGSIATQFMYYYPNGLSFANSLSSTMRLFSNAITGKTAHAAVSYSGLCPQDGDWAVANSGVAAGPLCDVKYGIPTGYLGTDPQTIASYLVAEKQIDEDGNVIPGSDLEAWGDACNSGDTFTLAQCTIGDDGATADAPSATLASATTPGNALLAASPSNNINAKHAYYSLYTIDKQTIDAMDNEISNGYAGSASGTVSLVDPSKWAVPANTDGNINQSSPEWQRWVAAIGGNGNSSTGVLRPIDIVDPNICPQSNRLNQDGGGNMFNPNAAASVKALIESFNKANPGKYLVPGACFRSVDAQIAAYLRSGGHQIAGGEWVGGSGVAAVPRTSNHGWGLAIDFRIASTNSDGTPSGNGIGISSYSSPEYIWLTNNGYQFGWSNPSEMRQGGSGPLEPWHWQYVGPLFGN